MWVTMPRPAYTLRWPNGPSTHFHFVTTYPWVRSRFTFWAEIESNSLPNGGQRPRFRGPKDDRKYKWAGAFFSLLQIQVYVLYINTPYYLLWDSCKLYQPILCIKKLVALSLWNELTLCVILKRKRKLDFLLWLGLIKSESRVLLDV